MKTIEKIGFCQKYIHFVAINAESQASVFPSYEVPLVVERKYSKNEGLN